MTEPLCVLDGHLRKVNFALFHPTAENVIATASADHTVKLWDAGVGGAEKVTLEGHVELVQDIKWSYDGSTLATSSKDKLMRLMTLVSQKLLHNVNHTKVQNALRCVSLETVESLSL